MRTLMICITILLSVTIFSSLFAYSIHTDKQSLLAIEVEALTERINTCETKRAQCLGIARRLLDDNQALSGIINENVCESM